MRVVALVGAVGDGEKVRVELVWLSLHWLKDGYWRRRERWCWRRERQGLTVVASSWWELAASPADSRPELPNLRLVELAFVACAQAMRRACRPGLRGRRQRRESLGMAQKKAGQAHGRLVARARPPRACQAAHAQSTAVPKLKSAGICGGGRPVSSAESNVRARINVGSELHYRNKFLR